jgi:TRAP transporter TAXI family solute receptor
MSVWRIRFSKTFRDGALAFFGLAALGLAAYFIWHVPQEQPIKLRMTAGQVEGVRQRLAEILRQEAGRKGIELTIVGGPGSEAALRDIDAGRLDLALVQGGLDLGDRPNLRQVATLHIEPLHLLVKKELYEAVGRSLTALKGKVVSLGEVGSGTHCLAREIMAFAGLKEGDFKERDLGYAELNKAPADSLPDAVFLVSTLPSPVARRLVTVHDFRLVALPFYEAFALGAIEQPPPKSAAPGRLEARIDRRHVYDATIPAFAYEVEPGIPPETIHTLGTRLLLVARNDVKPRVISRLLEVLYGSPFAQAVRPPLDARFLEAAPELSWHDGTVLYIERNGPLLVGDLIDLFEKELSIIGALLSGLYFLGQWLRRRYRRRRDRGFAAYIVRVTEIERRAMALERSATLDLPALLLLQEQLSDLKGEALEKFASGVLEGEELMSGFLTHISDTRDYLTRLILHERENLEERAHLEGRGVPTLWRETFGEASADATPITSPTPGGP